MNNKGLILTEVLVTMTVLSVAVLVLSSIINSAVIATEWSKNRMIAENLVVEGIEGVKNLRDTNVLQNPDDKSCWMRTNPALECPNLVFQDMSYVVKQNAVGEWFLDPDNEVADGGLDLSDGLDESYVMSVADFGNKFKGYVHGQGLESPFYRSATFTSVTADSVTFTILVQWMEGSKVRSLSGDITLNNH